MPELRVGYLPGGITHRSKVCEEAFARNRWQGVPSHQDVRDSNPRTFSFTPYRPIDVGCWSYHRNLAALM